MLTSEFIEKVEALGFVYELGGSSCVWHQIYTKDMDMACEIHKTIQYAFQFDSVYVEDEDIGKLCDIATEYAKTPISERESEKKYYLRFPNHHKVDGVFQFDYFILDSEETYYIGRKGYSKDKFTKSEIEELKTKFKEINFDELDWKECEE